MDYSLFNQQLCDFIAASPTPFHAVANMGAQLQSAGFTQLPEDTSWNLEPAGKYFVIRNASSIVAFVIGTDAAPERGMPMVGAHTDSPCLMVKPNPAMYSDGYLRLGVQVYGGALLNPWFDRDLSLAGRVSYRDKQGGLRSTLINYREPIASIPSLAIHLDRKANEERSVNAQQDIPPILCRMEEGETVDFHQMLLDRLRIENAQSDAQQVLDYELAFYDTQAPAIIGINQEFIASARLDNLLSCFTAMQALLACDGSRSALLICNDHEEVGSQSAVGAHGPLLRAVLERLVSDREDYAALIERSMLISADNAHGIHPNFPDRHDENHGPILNGGPVIKVNASQRYATNSETAGLFRLLADQEKVKVQSFVVRSDMGCGSTIGPITAGVTGIRTLDIGVPTFAMHSIRELGGARDPWDLCRVLKRFFSFAGVLGADA